MLEQLHQTKSLPRHVKPNHYVIDDEIPLHQPRLPQQHNGYNYGAASQRRNTSPGKEMKGRIENADYENEMKKQNINFMRSKTLDKDFRAHQSFHQRYSKKLFK